MPDEAIVSVIVPVRNGARLIGEALRSILPQLGTRDEIIVVDDASTDGTGDVARNVAPNARCLTCPGRGVSAARNAGLGAARGNFIAFLDHDDLWPAGGHHALRNLLDSLPSADAVAGRLRVRIEPGARVDHITALDGQHAPSILMSCLYRRDLINKTGLFDERLRYGEDFDYYLRLVDAGMRLVFSDSDALIYRRHADNSTNNAPPRQTVLMHVLARRAERHRAKRAAGSEVTPI